MKKLTVVGLLLQIVYYVLLVLSLGDYEYSGVGVGRAFAYWIYAIITAIPCVLCYLIPAVHRFQTDKSRHSRIMTAATVIGFLLLLTIGSAGDTAMAIVWNIYFLALFVLEIRSLFL